VPGIHNVGKVSDNLFRGAQPNLSSITLLKNMGITTIVDLRSESRGRVEHERREAEALGMRFVHIPIGGFSTPTDEMLASFFALFQGAPAQTIFVLFALGDYRPGVFIAAYRIGIQHWTPDQAMSEMLAFGFNHRWHPAMTTFGVTFRERCGRIRCCRRRWAPH
jgi:hypothetical protein